MLAIEALGPAARLGSIFGVGLLFDRRAHEGSFLNLGQLFNRP